MYQHCKQILDIKPSSASNVLLWSSPEPCAVPVTYHYAPSLLKGISSCSWGMGVTNPPSSVQLGLVYVCKQATPLVARVAWLRKTLCWAQVQLPIAGGEDVGNAIALRVLP